MTRAAVVPRMAVRADRRLSAPHPSAMIESAHTSRRDADASVRVNLGDALKD